MAIRLKRLFGRNKPPRLFAERLAAQSGAPIHISDAQGKTVFGEPSNHPTAPLLFEGEPIGTVQTENPANVADMLGSLVEIEQEKRGLASEVLDRYRELNLLYELAENLSDCHDVASISELVLSHASRVAPSDGGMLLLQSDDSPLYAAASIGTPLDPKRRESFEKGLLQRVLDSRKGELLDDVGPLSEEGGAQSFLCTPLKRRQESFGALFLHSSKRQAYSAGNLKLINSLASQAAPAIEAAKLYDRERQMSRSFARFVPDEFLATLGRSSVLDVSAGNHARQTMTIFFSDIRAFTTLLEGKSPEESYTFINEYIGYMEPCIRRNSGFVDKYIGDAIMALFGDGGAENAIVAAIESRLELNRYNEFRASRGEKPVNNGIGISTGPLTLGTIGSSDRVSCSVIGDSVNTASRVESLSKTYKTGILISNHTYDALEDPARFMLRPVDKVRVKGKTRVVTIYEVMDGLDEEILAHRAAASGDFLEGWRLYLQGNPGEALVSFANALQKDPSDRVTRLYLGRCWQFLEYGLPDGWDGVASMSKG
jgi:adenylate cyclase